MLATGLSYTAGEGVSWYNHLGNGWKAEHTYPPGPGNRHTCGPATCNPYNPTISLLRVSPTENLSRHEQECS